MSLGKISTRFADIESICDRDAIDSYLNSPLVSFEEAIVPINNLVPGIAQYAATAKLLSTAPADSLTEEESAAIYLYTMDSPLYGKLNSVMRSTHINHLKPYFLYLKLFCTALRKLPSEKATVWRGIRANISSTYVKGNYIVWHSPSSGSTDASVVTNFLDKNSKCTLFQIDCRYGRSISKYSAFPTENEILLMPGTKLLVRNNPLQFNGFQLVQLEETVNPNLKKMLTVLPNIIKSTAITKVTLNSAEVKLTTETLNPKVVLPAIKTATVEQVKNDNCE
ncbi:unnamed protein product [Adineta steineri]|uniref:NAD(P)(+)--arginine ADP-ribosyltransferase n=1 Tax=Adineta steineri TaxID=433720 RepID=A0A815ZYR3_9BILA|nr:unnamed protein product [Adineta steineri]CAF1588260.1 unnamed protein product [Adineta steineri]